MADPILKFGNDVWAVRGGSETDRGAALAYDDQNSQYKSIPILHKRLGGGSYVDRDGLIKYAGMHEPRVDFLNNSKGHLLLEPSRTNYSVYSEDTSTWTYIEFGSGSAGTITTGKTDMFGGTNAVQIDFPANAENVSIRFGHTTSGISSGSAQTSLYIKLVGSTTPDKIIQLRTGSDAENTTISGDSFVRYTKTHTKASNEAFNIKLRPSEGTSSGGFSIIVCHPQEEAGSYATSYIPTDSYVVSRTNDDSIRSANEYILEGCNTEGVLYLEMAALFDDLTQRRITISDGTYNNRIVVGYNNVSNRIFYFVILAGATIASGSYSSATITDFNKVAIKWKANDFAMWVNGSERHTDTSGGVFSSGTLNVFRYANAVGSQEFFGKIKETKIFDTALSDSELQALTS